jgi:hypothetical protein
MLLLRGKSTYPGCSDFRSHLFVPSVSLLLTPGSTACATCSVATAVAPRPVNTGASLTPVTLIVTDAMSITV